MADMQYYKIFCCFVATLSRISNLWEENMTNVSEKSAVHNVFIATLDILPRTEVKKRWHYVGLFTEFKTKKWSVIR